MLITNKKTKLSAIRTATQIHSYFVRRGNKECIENKLRELIIHRATKPTKVNVANLFNSFYLSATPFISLKVKRLRRGNRVLSKLTCLENNRSYRRACLAISRNIQPSSTGLKPFIERFERELDNLSSSSSIGKISSQIQEKRNEIHRQAYQSRPFV